MTLHLESFDRTMRKSEEWLLDLMHVLGTDDAQIAYGALRGVLHALRDRLPVNEAVELSAQLPMLLQGLYFHGWTPKHKPYRIRDRAEFLALVAHGLDGRAAELEPERAVRAVVHMLAHHVSPGELATVKRALPAAIRELWPASVRV